MNITSPSVRHTRFMVGIPKDLKARSVQLRGSVLNVMFKGCKSQVLVIKYPRCFDCRQIVSVGEEFMQVFRISKQGS